MAFVYDPATFNNSGIKWVIGDTVKYNDGQSIDFNSSILRDKGVEWLREFNRSGINWIIGNTVKYNDGQSIDFGSSVLNEYGIDRLNAYNSSGIDWIIGNTVKYSDGQSIDFGSDLMRGVLENISIDATTPEPTAPVPTPTPEPTPAPVPTPTKTSQPETDTDDKYYDYGSFKKGENFVYEAEVAAGGIFDIYFTATGSQVIYSYFQLYDFTDDLDLTLYKFVDSKYLKVASSEELSNEEEVLFKGLTPGDYILEISHYEDIDNSDAASPFTVSIDSNIFYNNSILPDDTLFSNQWHLLNYGQSGGIDNEDILAPEAWKIRSTSPDVIVAVIDTGIQLNHPDLDDNLWFNSAEIPGNGIDDDNNGYVDDMYGWNFPANSNILTVGDHGTHVAGIIGAEGDNRRGVTGVSWDTQLMSLDVFDGRNSYSDQDLLEAIYYAADNGADIINMSLGGIVKHTTISDWRTIDPNSYSAYFEALSYAVDKGSTVVIAAGNDDATTDLHLSIPAAFSSVIDGVISVAAIANTGNLTDYTNYGSLVTIAAPGGNLEVGGGILSTVTSNRYEEYPGTSMASPIVAGAAALIKAENPKFTPADIETILTNSATKHKTLNKNIQDGNYLNLKEALMYAQTFEPSLPPSTPSSSSTTGSEQISEAYDQAEYNLIEGNNRNNKLKGTNNNDFIFGFEGGDKINGKKGDDIIDPGVWDGESKFDIVQGKKGADKFIIKESYWAFIKDFKIMEDTLDLSGLNGFDNSSWEIKRKMTFIYGDDDYEVARLKGKHDLSKANIII